MSGKLWITFACKGSKNRQPILSTIKWSPVLESNQLKPVLQTVALPFGQRDVAGVTGFEPATSAVTGQRSNALNYTPKLERVVGLEPTTLSLATICSTD